MSAEISHEEQVIRAELDAVRSRILELRGELRYVDAEIDAVAEEQRQFELVDEICASLEKLGEAGGSDLFWSGLPGANFDAHVREVRSRASEFHRRFGEIETRRSAIAARVAAEEETWELLDDDLAEARFQEEMKKLEWVPDREDHGPAFLDGRMPWSHGGEEDIRFRKSLAAAMLAALLLALLLPIIPLPEPDRYEVIEIPERLTRLIKEEPEPEPEPIVQERQTPQETQPEIPEEPQKLAQDTTPKSDPTPQVAEKVASAGILALREQFAGLADSDAASRIGTRARINRAGESAAGQAGRSLVTTQSARSSGGINVNAIGRDAVGGGGQALEGVQVARATSSIGTASGNGRPLSDGPGLSRTDEEIQIVFDRHKAALYRLYNRELRRNPTLQGQIVLKIVIEADGSVSLCEVKSSDMDAPGLSAQVVERVKLFDFGAKEGIPPVSILYPIDFLPAA